MCKILLTIKGDDTRELWNQPLMNLVLSAKNIHWSSKRKYLYIFLHKKLCYLIYISIQHACTQKTKEALKGKQYTTHQIMKEPSKHAKLIINM